MSFHKQQKCFGLPPLAPPLKKMLIFFWGDRKGRGGGGADDVEKVGRTSGKILATNLLKPEKTTGILRNVLITCPGSYFHGSADQESFITEWKLLVTSSEKKSHNSDKQSIAIFRRLDLELCGLVCSPVWILDISNIWEHHAKVRATDVHSIVLYAKIWFHGRKTFTDFLILVLCPPFDNFTWPVHLAGSERTA